MTQFLFITDLDNTLVGDDDAMGRLNDKLEQHRQTHGTRIVYSTGRSLVSYKELQAEKSLLEPDAVITGVGTAIYYPETEEADPHWWDQLTPGWNRETVVAIAGEFADLVPQPVAEQGPFKVSYYLSETVAADMLPVLEKTLEQHGIQSNVIYSGGKDLDILPKAANKGLALTFIRQKWQFDPHRTVACGDSGNDLALFAHDANRGIIVGNARPELLAWHHANPSEHRYLATAVCAGGILEGLLFFGYL